MPIIDEVGRKTWYIRLVTALMYLVLAILGVGMAFPFLMTLTASTSNSMDYRRFSPFPKSAYSREDRFVRGIVQYYPDLMRNNMDQFYLQFRDVPAGWSNWQSVGEDTPGVKAFANRYMSIPKNAKQWEKVQLAATDYSAFADDYDISDSICSVNPQHVAQFFRRQYIQQAKAEGVHRFKAEARALQLISENWKVPYTTFYAITPEKESSVPMDQPAYQPQFDGRAKDFDRLKVAYRDRVFIPGMIKSKWKATLTGENARKVLGLTGSGRLSVAELNSALGTKYRSFNEVPYPVTANEPKKLKALWESYVGSEMPVCQTRPYPMKSVWTKFLGSADERTALGLEGSGMILIDEFNKAFGTKYASIQEIPFPVPADAPAKMQEAWKTFVQTQYPRRMIELKVTPELVAKYRSVLRERLKNGITEYNQLTGEHAQSWDDVTVSPRLPSNLQLATIWMSFVEKDAPYEAKIPVSAESEYQKYLLEKYASLQAINEKYDWNLTSINQAQMPYDLAYLVTYQKNEFAMYASSIASNYAYVLDYLILRGRALFNTVVLIALALLAALTVNPLAAYALSRFQMRQMPSIILFMLATMAFPAAVSMIPAYLLMRDLHMLNTYAALVLPTIANGMNIFLLKGFFDSLPRELYEAASLDGAQEWQMFLRITLPLSKPILAVMALTAFMHAYNGWEWAIVVCQKQSMWTIAVWLFQFNNFAASQPWAIMAAFVIASLPVFVTYLLCQNVILRGIILPQMK